MNEQTLKKTSFKTVSKELFALSLPMALTQLIAVGSGFITMAMVSGLGRDVLAASALIFSTRITILIVGSSILFSLSVLVGHAFGQRDYQRIGNFMQHGWLLGFLLSLPVMALFWWIHPLLVFLGEPQELTTIVNDFFQPNAWNVIPFFLSVCNQQLLYGVRKQQIDLVANLIGVVILLICAYPLIFGKLGLPKLGVIGLAYAFNLQSWCYFLFTLAIIFFGDYFKHFKIFQFRAHQTLSDFVHMLKIAWPICIQIAGEMSSILVCATLVGWLGVQSLAAYQVATQYLFLILVPLLALSQATGILVGQAHGEKNHSKIEKIAYAGIAFSTIISVITTLVFVVAPGALASLYMNVDDPSNQQTFYYVKWLFLIFGLQMIVDGARNVLTGSLRGLLDTRYPMVVGLTGIWIIGIPLGYFLGFHTPLGVMGVESGVTIGLTLAIFPLMIRWRSQEIKG